jgi:hypothetical protein
VADKQVRVKINLDVTSNISPIAQQAKKDLEEMGNAAQRAHKEAEAAMSTRRRVRPTTGAPSLPPTGPPTSIPASVLSQFYGTVPMPTRPLPGPEIMSGLGFPSPGPLGTGAAANLRTTAPTTMTPTRASMTSQVEIDKEIQEMRDHWKKVNSELNKQAGAIGEMTGEEYKLIQETFSATMTENQISKNLDKLLAQIRARTGEPILAGLYTKVPMPPPPIPPSTIMGALGFPGGGGRGRVGGTLDMEKMREMFDRIGEGLNRLGTQATTAFALGTGGILAMTRAASPEAFNTLTGSIQLLAGQIGISFMPQIIQVSGALQQAADWVRHLDSGTKASIATWVAWGVAGTGAAMILHRIALGAKALVVDLIAVGSVAKGAFTAIYAFSVAHPVVAGLTAIGLAVGTLAGGYALLRNRAQDANQALSSTQALDVAARLGRPEPQQAASRRVDIEAALGVGYLRRLRGMSEADRRAELADREQRLATIVSQEQPGAERRREALLGALPGGDRLRGLAALPIGPATGLLGAATQAGLTRREFMTDIVGAARQAGVSLPADFHEAAIRMIQVARQVQASLKPGEDFRTRFIEALSGMDAVNRAIAARAGVQALQQAGLPAGAARPLISDALSPEARRGLGVMLSMNMAPRQMAVESLHDYIQQESIRAPLEQRLFEQQMEALQALVKEAQQHNMRLDTLISETQQNRPGAAP